MSDFLKYQRPGPLDASHHAWNAFVDVARKDRDGKLGGRNVKPPILEVADPYCEILVRNDTGSDLPVRSVLVPSTPLVGILDSESPSSFQKRPVVQAFAPTAVTEQPVILVEPIADGSIGRAAIAGVAVVDVLLNASNHQYAAPAVGVTAYLDTASFGPCRIIDKQTLGGSLYRAWVVMGIDRAGPGTCQEIVADWTCDEETGTATVVKKWLWLPPGVEIYDTEEACDDAHPE